MQDNVGAGKDRERFSYKMTPAMTVRPRGWSGTARSSPGMMAPTLPELNKTLDNALRHFCDFGGCTLMIYMGPFQPRIFPDSMIF